MNDKPTHPMTADEIIEVLDRAYWQCIGPQPTLAGNITKARSAVAEIIRRNGELERAVERKDAALVRLDESFCKLSPTMTKEDRHEARLALIEARHAIAYTGSDATGERPWMI